MNQHNAQEKSKKRIFTLLIVVFFLICAVSVVYLVWVYYNNYMAQNTYGDMSHSYVDTTKHQQEQELPENPIDFISLKEINSDVYAWITVPNTKIDYPIVQNEETDYYLRRSIYKKYLFAGSIYTNKSNSKDFSDPVTVVYGHNMRNDTMFTMLHEFENKTFFEENEFFYIYTPERKLTYRIVSALKYDNRRITAVYDFTDTKQIENFQYSILNPKFDLFNSRDIKLTAQDKILTLSTCVSNQSNYRYLVNGVLIKDELTK